MQELCKRLGMNSKEANMFLALMELGAQPVSVLSKHLALPRSTTYLRLSKLKELHLIEEFEHKGIKYVKCIPAQQIDDLLKNKERDLAQTRSLLSDELPALEALESTLSVTPKVQFFEGKAQIMKMYAQIMKERSFCAFFDPASVKTMLPEFHDDIPRMLKANGGKAREFVVDSSDARDYRLEYKSKRHQIRLLPPHMQFSSDIIICKDHIYMTAYGKQKLSAVQVFSNVLAQTHQVIFDELWERVG